jgi:hypothetical protein
VVFGLIRAAAGEAGEAGEAVHSGAPTTGVVQ